MSIEAGHWATVVSRVTDHARKLHPKDAEAQRKLVEHLLGFASQKSLKDMEAEFLGKKRLSRFERIKRLLGAL